MVFNKALYVTTSGGIFRFKDGGNSWTQAIAGLPTTNVFSLLVFANTLYAGTDGDGIFRSEDGGDSWTQVSTGLTYLHVTSLAVDGTTLLRAH